MKNQLPKVSVVSVNFRQAKATGEMLASLAGAGYPNLEVILVDNGMIHDQSAFFHQKYPGLRLFVQEANLGFAGGTNLGIRHATGAYILLLNNDTETPPGFLQPMVDLMEANPQMGTVSPKILYFDSPNTIQYAGMPSFHPLTGRGLTRGNGEKDKGQYNETAPTTMTHGACMLVRREVFDEIGLLPEMYFMYYEELDFCAHASQKGWQHYYCGTSHIYHKQSLSLGKGSPKKTYYLFRNRLLFMRRTQSGLRFLVFLLYFLGIAFPYHLFRHAVLRDYEHAASIWKGMIWHITHLKNPAPENVY